MKILLWISGIAIALIVIVFVFIALAFIFATDPSNTQSNYVKNYFAVLGLQRDRLYSNAVEIFGEPLNIVPSEHSDYIFMVQYDGIDLVVSGTPNNPGSVVGVRIYSPKFRFGDKEIGIGSTREEIEIAYKGFGTYRRGRNSLTHTDYGILIIDGFTWLEFHLDENEMVVEIVMYTDGP